MSRVVKINLNGGVKRIVSTLICLMMVLATFPMHMLRNTVSAAGGDPINLTLGDEKDEGATVGNGSEVKDWMTVPTEALADANTVKNAGDINITLSNDIGVARSVAIGSLPTMSANGRNLKYLFDFTDPRFAGKTITIDGGNHTIKIDNKDLFFLKLKGCRVILKNIIIDGGWIKDSDGVGVREGPFIASFRSDNEFKSELEIQKGTTIKNCVNAKNDGGVIVMDEGNLTINGVSISHCCDNGNGGVINMGEGNLTMNDVSISHCYASGNGGAIGVARGNVTITNVSITDCFAKGCGGAIYSLGANLTINSASISNCGAGTFGDAIALYSDETILNLPPKDFGFLTISLNTLCYLTKGDIFPYAQKCNHNFSCMQYDGIGKNPGGNINPDNAVKSNPNRKIAFVDSESSSTVGVAYGNKLEKITVPDSVLNRPGYEFVGMCYDAGTSITDIDDGKFALDGGEYDAAATSGVITVKVTYNKLYTVQYIYDGKVVGTKSGCSAGMDSLAGVVESGLANITLDGEGTPTLYSVVGDEELKAKGYVFSNFTYGKDNTEVVLKDSGVQTATTWENLKDSAIDNVITVHVNYDKPYTVQYIYGGKVVGIKSGCSAGMDLGKIINNTFSNITLDDGQKLDDVVKPGEGYTFSNFTYGNGQTYTDGTTTWENLKASAVDNVITVILNYTDSGTVKYVASGCMILDKKSKLTNYSGVNLPIGGLQKVPKPKNVIFDFCRHTIHHNDPNVSFIQTEAGKNITICNLKMDGSGCK